MKLVISSHDAPSLSAPSRRGVDEEVSSGAHIGRFLVLRKLGDGGMGVVYAAYDGHLERTVAVKLLGGRLDGNDADSLARFEREARALAQLSHPNVVQIHEVGPHASGMFIAMEYVQGETLQRWLETPRSWRVTVEVLIQAGRGLEAAHRAKLVHRDFKPGNVMIGDDGRVRVLDFGLVHGFDESDERITRRDASPGTPAYMAPEQLEGREVDPLTDQFAFCIVAFEALHGVLPFGSGPLLARATRMMMGKIQPRPARTKVPRSIDAVIRRGLCVAPERRWPSLGALLRELEHCLDHRRRVTGGLLGLCGVLALVAGAAVVKGQLDRLRHERDQQVLIEGHNDALRDKQVETECNNIVLKAQSTGRQIEALVGALSLFHAPRKPDQRFDVERGMLAATQDLRMATALHHPAVVDVAFDPTQPRMATAGRGGEVWLWDARTGERLREWLDHGAGLRALTLSADGRWLLTVGEGRARVWSLEGSEPRQILVDTKAEVAEFSPDARRFAVGGSDGSLRVYSLDPRGRVVLEKTQRVGESIRALAFSPDNEEVITHDSQSGIQSFELVNPRQDGRPAPIAARGPVFIEGSLVATVEGQVLRVWDGETSWVTSLGEHPLGVVDVDVSPHGRIVVTTSVDSIVRVWALHDGRRIAALEGQPGLHSRARLSPTGERVAVVSSDDRVVVWSIARAVEQQRIAPGTTTVTGMAATPDASRVVIGTRGGASLVDGSGSPLATTGHWIAPHAYVEAVAASTEGWWVTGDSEGEVLVWFGRDDSPVHQLPTRERAVTEVALLGRADDPSFGMLAVGDEGGGIEIWRANGVVCKHGNADDGRVAALEFSPDGRWLAVATLREVEVLAVGDCSSAPHHRVRFATDEFPLALTFAPDSERIAIGGQRSSITIWSLVSGARMELASTDTIVHGLEFSRDGARLFSAGDRHSLVWDMARERELADLGMSTQKLFPLGFTADGLGLDLGYDDGRVVRTQLDVLVRAGLACASMSEVVGPERLADACRKSTPGQPR